MSLESFLGKKCFFISSDWKKFKHLIFDVFKDGFETYIIDDIKKIKNIKKEFESSVVFILIDEIINLKEIAMELSSLKIQDLKVNIIYAEKDNKKLNVIKKISIDNYFKYKKDTEEVVEKLKEYLYLINAKGRRQYVRVSCIGCDENQNHTGKFKAIFNDNEYSGEIEDISIAGMRVSFNDINLALNKDQKLEIIILKLDGYEVKISGSVLRYESGLNQNLYVLLFDLSSMKEDDREIIYKFIFSCLQEYIDKK